MARKEQAQDEMPEPEVLAPEPSPAALQMVKLEFEAMGMMAARAPRNHDACLNTALADLDACPEWAEKAWYTLIFSKGTAKENIVEGLSIKAMACMARAWKYTRCGFRVVGEDAHSFLCEGYALDMQTMFAVSRQVSVSKTYKPKGETKHRSWPESFWPALRQQAGSKAMRNAIGDILPEWFKRAFWNHARAIYARREAERLGAKGGKSGKGKKGETKLDPQKVAAKILAGFEPFIKPLGLDTRKVVEKKAGKKLEKLTFDEIADLGGIKNALMDGQMTVHQAFGLEPEPQEGAAEAAKSGSQLGGEVVDEGEDQNQGR